MNFYVALLKYRSNLEGLIEHISERSDEGRHQSGKLKEIYG